MDEFFYTQAGIAALIAILLEVVPRLKDWWQPLVVRQKQVIILSIVAVIALATGFWPCLEGACPTEPLQIVNTVIGAFLTSLIASQGTHAGTKYLTAPKKE